MRDHLMVGIVWLSLVDACAFWLALCTGKLKSDLFAGFYIFVFGMVFGLSLVWFFLS